MQRVISGFYSAVRGGQLFAVGLLQYLVHYGHIAPTHEVLDCLMCFLCFVGLTWPLKDESWIHVHGNHGRDCAFRILVSIVYVFWPSVPAQLVDAAILYRRECSSVFCWFGRAYWSDWSEKLKKLKAKSAFCILESYVEVSVETPFNCCSKAVFHRSSSLSGQDGEKGSSVASAVAQELAGEIEFEHLFESSVAKGFL